MDGGYLDKRASLLLSRPFCNQYNAVKMTQNELTTYASRPHTSRLTPYASRLPCLFWRR